MRIFNQNYRLIEAGDRIQCINGRFIGWSGVCESLDYETYGQFCMTVEPSTGERVDPCNWMIINHVTIENPQTMIFK